MLVLLMEKQKRPLGMLKVNSRLMLNSTLQKSGGKRQQATAEQLH